MNRVILALVILVLLPSFSICQEETEENFIKGQHFIEASSTGAFQYFRTIDSYYEVNQFSISLSPSYGRFISDKMVLGGKLSIRYIETGYGIGSSQWRLGCSPFFRYFMGNKKVLPFIEIAPEINYVFTYFSNGYTQLGTSAGGGILTKLSTNLYLENSLMINYLRYMGSIGSDQSSIGLKYNIGIILII